MAITNSDTNNVGILLGYGNGTFSNQVTYSTGDGSHPYSVTVGDFNNDRHLDMAVANFGTNSIGIFLGNGDGTFTYRKNISTGSSRPISVAVGDFNRDMKLDIIITSYGTNNIGIVLGYGNGNFTTSITLSSVYDSSPFSITVGDFNNDNKLDIAVTNYGTHNIGVPLGYGNGNFSAEKTFTTGINSHPYSIALADFNNDTYLDITVTNSDTCNIGVFLGYGNGSFTIQTTYSTGNYSHPISVAIGDFNHDNLLDIIVANSGTKNVGLFFGYGNETFRTQITYSILPDSNPFFIATGNFNNDNRLDAAVVIYDTDSVNILLGSTTATFSSQVQYSTGNYSMPYSVAVGDFNKDGRLDIVVANYGTNNIRVFLGFGDGTFSSQTTYPTGNSSNPVSIVVGDFNKDGRLDIAVANQDSDNVGVLLGHGNGSFMHQKIYSTGSGSAPYSISVGDFNNDSKLDIAVANYDYDQLAILLGYGDGTFSSKMTDSIYSAYGPYSITVGDFNNDGHLDIAVANENDWNKSNVGVFLGYGNGTFSNQMSNPTEFGSYPRSVAVGDFNGDRRLDIVVASFQKQDIGVFLGNGDGTFSSQVLYSTASGSQSPSPRSIIVADFNNDNRLDIAVANSNSFNVGILFGIGDGTFSKQVTYYTGDDSRPYSVTVGDFNSDGRLDIVVANSGSNKIGIFLGLEATELLRKATYLTGFSLHPCGVAIGDLNNDTQMDIAVANSAQDNVGVLLGYKNTSFPVQTTYSTGSSSLPISVALGDFNNDSRLDISVINADTGSVGLFLGYGNGTFADQIVFLTGLDSHPFAVASADVNNDHIDDVVLSNNGYGNIKILSKMC